MSETHTPPQTLQHRWDGPDDAPVLVLGPSLATTWHMWDRQIAELTRQWRVLRFDLPGHGGAPAHPAASIADLAGRLLATLDELGVQRFGYAGCAVGGAIGIELALRRPDRIAALALVAASPRFGTPDEFRRRGGVVRANGLDPIARTAPERWFTQAFAAGQPAIVEWAVQMVRTTDPGCYVAACEALAAFDVTAELGRIAVPTLVAVGSEDQLTGPVEARTLVEGIPDARLALVPGASHLAPVEQPAAVTELLVHHFATAWQPASDGAPGMNAPMRPASPFVPEPPAAASPFVPEPPAPVPAFVPVPVPVFQPASDAPEASAAPEPAAPAPATPAAEPGPAPTGVGVNADGATGPVRPDPYEAGMRVRRDVLGDAHVDRANAAADDFTRDFQDLLTRYAWGEIWTRDGLDRRTRSCITLTALVAGGHLDELAFHTRAALRNGLSPAEIREVLLHAAVYCGVPAANSAFRVAQAVVQEETGPRP
ncbi:4-carboxymuconolactone decarboxylase [Streptomyces sp. HNM0663]|uniref:4-carboxymuconolactone decarboxylase n=1 Tax=Streptomyces chengmaiensis TaxID=3040919 RepID=A0ABT6HK90_9ACTN|nr:4-carboxymuconolactone decarboxylase [Streptomyces chengmaiensis]MDH2389167.1 4-carboxymuconolactone decarboxylase [Streptomyces chengmaiensis]